MPGLLGVSGMQDEPQYINTKPIFDVSGISPYSIKNHNDVKELIYYGTMAA